MKLSASDGTSLRRLVDEVSCQRPNTDDSDLPLVALEHIEPGRGCLTQALSELPRVSPEGRTSFFRTDDVLFGKLRPYLGKAWLAEVSGVSSGDLLSLRADRSRLLPRYLRYLVLSQPFLAWAEATSYGVKMPRTSWDAISMFPVPGISPGEQRRIADFLDVEVGRIDDLLSLNRELLGLLAARRQAVLSRAVSCGIDPDVETTGTPLPGLDGVPVHWEVVRLKYVVPDITVGIVVTPAQYYAPEGPPCLRGVNVSPGKVSDRDLVRIDAAANEAHHKSMLRAGDVVAVRTGLTGTAAVVPDWAVGGNCVDLLLLRKSPRMLPKFLEHIINSDFARDQIARGSVGTIQSHFNVGALRELVVCVPPLPEQQQIIDHLEGELGRLADLEAEVVEQRRLIEERRHALITAAVTGQIDVTTAGKAA